MKTKTIRNSLFVLISLLAVTMLSCKNSSSGTFTGSDKQPLNITIAANEMIKFTKTSNSSRTIVAEPFKSHDAEKNALLDFYLWGTAQSGQTLEPKLVDVSSDDGVIGKVVLDIDCYNWSLTLAACDKAAGTITGTGTGGALTPADVLKVAVLVGYGNVDMMFTNSIKFTLTPKGLSKTGNVNLTLKLATSGDPATAWTIPEGYVATAYIYDITTGKQILGGTEGADSLVMTLYDAAAASPITDLSSSSGATYNANSKVIKPGTYSFQVEFTKAGENRKYVWNDTLIILPGKTVTQEITIPNLVGTKPHEPTDLIVQFNKHMNNTDLEDEKEESKFPGYYTAHLSWDGSSVNTEMNFALQIAELKDTTDITTAIADDAAFDAIFEDVTKVNATYTFDYLNDIRADPRFYRDGSLFANNEWVDIYLELGKKYIARLYSENNAGYSDVSAIATITPVEDDATLTTINRYRIKYWNQGGIWNHGEVKGKENESTTNTGYNLPRIEYWSQNINTEPAKPYVVLNPLKTENPETHALTNTEASPYLYSGAADWIYWVTDLTSDTKYPYTTGTTTPAPYTGYKNLDLYAVYARQGDFVIYNDKDYDIDAVYVAAFGVTSPAQTSVNTVSKGTLGYHKDTAPEATTTVTLTLPSPVSPATEPSWVYDKVTFEISYSGVTYFNETQTGEARGTANTFTIPLKQLPTGYTYNCKITAQYQMTTISYPFWIALTD